MAIANTGVIRYPTGVQRPTRASNASSTVLLVRLSQSAGHCHALRTALWAAVNGLQWLETNDTASVAMLRPSWQDGLLTGGGVIKPTPGPEI